MEFISCLSWHVSVGQLGAKHVQNPEKNRSQVQGRSSACTLTPRLLSLICTLNRRVCWHSFASRTDTTTPRCCWPIWHLQLSQLPQPSCMHSSVPLHTINITLPSSWSLLHQMDLSMTTLWLGLAALARWWQADWQRLVTRYFWWRLEDPHISSRKVCSFCIMFRCN